MDQQPLLPYLSSADLIGGNGDILRNILIHIPEKPLSRFKSVSKTWLKVISDPHFSLRWHTNHIPSASALFYYADYHCSFIPFDDRETNTFGPIFNFDSIRIHQSCNGLLLITIERYYNYGIYGLHFPLPICVFNPTTNQSKIIPDPPPEYSGSRHMYLAFDPLKSPHFKIFSVSHPVSRERIMTYSSETETWRESSRSRYWTSAYYSFRQNYDYFGRDLLVLDYGVFVNGAIHWPSCSLSSSLRLDVDKERYFHIPMPPIQGGKTKRMIRYFGESGAHLHLIDCEDSALQFDVFEMKNDYSEWFVKYRVDLADALGWRFIAYGWDTKRFNVVILSLIVNGDEVEGEEESLVLVMHVPAGEIVVSYNLKNDKLKKLCPLSPNPTRDPYIGKSSMINKFIRSPVRF